MSRRTLLLGGASGLAAAIFLLSLLAGSPDAAESLSQDETEPVGDMQLPTLNITQRIERPEQMRQLTATGEGGQLTFKESGRTTVLHYERLEPQPRGVFEVDQPSAQVLFSDTLVMTIDSDSATIVAPNNDLRRGTFRNTVKLSLFETEPGTPVDTSRMDQLILRAFLDETSFDVELGSVESPGEIRLTGPQLSFEGTGLSISFNELHRRLDKLEVFRARAIRFRPDELEAEPEHEERVDGAETETVAQASDRPLQFYRARVENKIQVRGVNDQLKIDADHLEAIFSLTDSSMPSPSSEGASTARRDVSALESPDDPSPVTTPRSKPALFVPDDERDIVVALDGRLIVEPEPAPPADLGAEDVLVRLASRPDSGRQVVIQTPEGETVEAPEADYLVSSARVRATGTPDRPVVMNSKRLGTIRGTQMAMDQTRGTGYVTGPGRIEARIDQTGTPQTAGDAGPAAPEPLQLAWNDRLDLRFYVNAEATPGLGSQQRIVALRSATFRGEVKAHESRFDLDAEQLTMELTEPTVEDDGRQYLREIDAAGAVALALRDDEQPYIHAEQLNIALSTDEAGKPMPTRLLARDRVRTRIRDIDLAAGMLDVAFDPDGEASNGEGPADSAAVAIRQIVAEDDVRVQVADPAVELSAPRLRADVKQEQLELIGNRDQPARLQREGNRIQAEHMVLSQSEQTVSIDGAGKLDIQLDGEDDPLTLTWQEAMHYDHPSARAQFTGDVVAQRQADQGASRTRMTAPQLELVLEPQASDDDSEAADIRRLEIDSLTAGGGVRFLSETHSPLLGADARQVLESRLTIEAPRLAFDRASEQIQFIEPGHMLIENYRPEPMLEVTENEPELPSFVGPDVSFSGRGVTLFQWDKRLVLDARHNDMIVDEAVKMTHRPASGGDLAQMDADRFILDLHETGGLERLFAGDQPQPQVKLIRADGHVIVMDGQRTIFTDHLQYTNADATVLLWADRGGQVEARDEDESVPLQAGSIRWNLERNRLIVEDIEGGILPIQRETETRSK